MMIRAPTRRSCGLYCSTQQWVAIPSTTLKCMWLAPIEPDFPVRKCEGIDACVLNAVVTLNLKRGRSRKSIGGGCSSYRALRRLLHLLYRARELRHDRARNQRYEPHGVAPTPRLPKLLTQGARSCNNWRKPTAAREISMLPEEPRRLRFVFSLDAPLDRPVRQDRRCLRGGCRMKPRAAP